MSIEFIVVCSSVESITSGGNSIKLFTDIDAALNERNKLQDMHKGNIKLRMHFFDDQDSALSYILSLVAAY